MSFSLKPVNSRQGRELNDKNTEDNFSILEHKLALVGTQLLASVVSSSNQSVAAVGYVNTPYVAGVRISAGLLKVEAMLACSLDAGTAAVALFIDGSQVCTKLVPISVGMPVSFVYAAQVQPGPHRVELRWQASGGTLQVNQAGLDTPSSELFVYELFIP